MVFEKVRRIVGSEPGNDNTATAGSGGILIDDHGSRYRVVDAYEAATIRNSTGGRVYTLHPDGTVQ